MRSRTARAGHVAVLFVLTLLVAACPDGDPFSTDLNAGRDDDDATEAPNDDDLSNDDDLAIDDDDTGLTSDDDDAVLNPVDDDDTIEDLIDDDDATGVPANDDDSAQTDDDDTAQADDDDTAQTDDDDSAPADDDDTAPTDDDDSALADDDDTAQADDDDTALADDDDTALADDDDSAQADDDDSALADDDDSALADDDDSAGPAEPPNRPPGVPTIAIEPSTPFTIDALVMDLVSPSVDPDGDPINYDIAWTVNGVPAPAFGEEVDATATAKHQIWSVEVTAFDGLEASLPATASVVVENSPPTIGSVEASPSDLLAGGSATCLTNAVYDPDGDSLQLGFSWFVDAVEVDTDQDLDSTVLSRGQEVSCIATVTDDDGATAAADSELVVVGNTPPTPPAVALSGADGDPGTELLCEVIVESGDVDGDLLSYQFAWTVNAAPTQWTGPVLPAGTTDFSQIWTCSAQAHDGTDAGAWSGVASFGTCNPNLWFFDLDGDGDGDNSNSISSCSQPEQTSNSPWDCNDDDATIHPWAGDVAGDGIDSDCDGYDCEADFLGPTYFSACPNPATWDDGHALCLGMGYTGLAQMLSADEQALLSELTANAALGDTAALWLGLSDGLAEGTWQWPDGSEPTYTEWAPGQPAAMLPEQDCAMLVLGGEDSEMWVAGDCLSTAPLGDLGTTGVICEQR